MFGLLAALALAAAPPPASRKPGNPDNQVICLSAPHWRVDNAETRRIASVPVPQSFRDLFYGDSCTRRLLQKDALIDWHLAFGTEASTTSALAFLEAGLTRDAAAPAQFAAAAERAWQDAERDHRKAAPGLAGTPDVKRQARNRLYGSRAFRRLRELTEAHENHIFLAQQYLRATEHFGSPSLLARAETHLDPARHGIRILYRGVATTIRGEDQGLTSFLDLNEGHIVVAQDLEMRLAVARARMSGDPAEIDAAGRIIDRAYSPILYDALEDLDEKGGAVCAFPDVNEDEGEDEDEKASVSAGDKRADTVRKACREENYFEWRVINFWRNRIGLEMLMAAKPEHYSPRSGPPLANRAEYVRNAAPAVVSPEYWPFVDFERVVDLLERARRDMPAGARYPRRIIADDLIAFYLARADMLVTLAGRPGMRRAQQYESEALESLARAERLARPSDAPGRFRQIAERHLAIRASIVARTDGRDAFGNRPDNERMDAYLRQVLDGLDRISVGGMPPR